MARRCVALFVAATAAIAGCDARNSGPSIADGGLAVYSVSGPDDLDTLVVAEALREVLDLPAETRARTRGPLQARIDGAGHEAVIMDRGAGSVIVSYSSPRFENSGCVSCPLLDETDKVSDAIEESRVILDAIGIDTSNVVFSERLRDDDDELFITGDVVIDGVPIDDLGFNFVWTHGLELSRLSGGIFAIKTIGTVAPRDEADARAEAESKTGSERTIEDFTLTYIGAFRDGELIVAPAYIATTDLGTTFTVTAFTGKLPS